MIKINDGNMEPQAEDKKVPEEVTENRTAGSPEAEAAPSPEDANAACAEEAAQSDPESGQADVPAEAAAGGGQMEEAACEGDPAADGANEEAADRAAHEADPAADGAKEETSEGDQMEDSDKSVKPEDGEAPAGDPESDEAGEPEADDADCDGADCEEPEEAGKEPGMFFGSRKLKKEIEKKEELIKEQVEKYIRLMAEFDNYRKRTEKEKSVMYAMGVKDVVEKILPVVDNFERGFSLVAAEDAEDPFTEGMLKIYKQLMTTLTDIGVTPIEAVGKEFDPNLHNAVMHVDDDSVGENIIVQEFQKGYMYKDSVVRHSMVQVAN